MYRVKTVIRGHLYQPGPVPTEEDVRKLIHAAYAGWGIPLPASLDETNAAHFAARLAKKGSYIHVEADTRTTVRRTTPPETVSDLTVT